MTNTHTTNTVPSLDAVIGDAQVYDLLPRLLAAAAFEGVDVGDLLGHACTEATRLLPRGMTLTVNRSGSWEASHIDALTAPDAESDGPGPAPLDVECLICGADAGSACWWTPREVHVWLLLLSDEQVERTACELYDCEPADLPLDDEETPRDLLRLTLDYADRPRSHGSRVWFANQAGVSFVQGLGWVL